MDATIDVAHLEYRVDVTLVCERSDCQREKFEIKPIGIYW